MNTVSTVLPTDRGLSATPDQATTTDLASGVLGLWLFLVSEFMFFGPLLVAYAWGRLHYGDAFAVASRHTSVLLGTLNTALLLTSSAAMAVAVEAHRCGDARLARRCLWGVAALGLCFLAIKGGEYRMEWREQLLPGHLSVTLPDGVRVFYFLYLVITALHALHLGAGLVLVALAARGLARQPDGASASGGSEGAIGHWRIELTGLYWHFVDVVWIFLYPLLYLVGRST